MPLWELFREKPEAVPGSSRLESLRGEVPARCGPAASVRACRWLALLARGVQSLRSSPGHVWMEGTHGVVSPGAAAGHQDTSSSSKAA